MEKPILTGLDLKITRIRAGVMQYKLAAKLGIGTTRLSEMETGRRIIPNKLARKILKVLNEVRR